MTHFQVDSDCRSITALCGKDIWDHGDEVDFAANDAGKLDCPECLLRLAQLGIDAKARLAKLRATITAELNPSTGWFR